MGWTLSGCEFWFESQLTDVHASGNNAAWACAYCGHPILFTYRGKGGRKESPAACQGCGRQYYLSPEFKSSREPSKGDIHQPNAEMEIFGLS